MSLPMSANRVIKIREMLLRHGVDEINLRCLHLYNKKTEDVSETKLFGVLLCKDCEKDIKDEKDKSNV